MTNSTGPDNSEPPEFESQWFDRTTYRQHYYDEGDGPPVLMLHGNPSWSYYWRHLVLGLRGTHRCIVPDHIGMGLSSRPAERDYAYTLASRVDDLEALVTHLIKHKGAPTTGWTLAVHDWGGPIGMALADRHPDLIGRLVVLNTAAFPSPFSGSLPLMLRVPLWAIKKTRLAEYLMLRHNVFAKGAVRHGVHRRMAPEVRKRYLEPYDTPESRIAILRFVQDIPMSPADQAWKPLMAAQHATDQLSERPLFIGWGARDPVFRRVFLDEWLRRFPEARVRIYRDAGHYVLEDRTEDIVEDIRSFLADNPCGGSARDRSAAQERSLQQPDTHGSEARGGGSE